MNVFELSRRWFDWCFENPEKIKPVHTAMYFFIIEHCNRLGWKEKFGLPMQMAKDAIGISNYRTYSSTLKDLFEWGFLIEVQKSKNQYSSTIIAIAKNTKANTKALDKALQKHSQKHCKSIVCIDILNNNKPNNLLTIKEGFEKIYKLFQKPKSVRIFPDEKSKSFKNFSEALKKIDLSELEKNVKDYLEYLDFASWRKKKAFDAWMNNSEHYANDWVGELEAERKKEEKSSAKKEEKLKTYEEIQAANAKYLSERR